MSYHEVIIKVPSIVAIVRNGASVQVAADKINEAMWSRLAEHGFEQKVGDAASGAKKANEETGIAKDEYSRAQMLKVIDALTAGSWGVEKGSGLTDEQRAEMYVATNTIRSRLANDKEKLAAFDKLEGDALIARLTDAIGKLRTANADAFASAVAARIAHVEEQRRKKAAEKAALAGLGGDLEL